jgi:hypothetical protein
VSRVVTAFAVATFFTCLAAPVQASPPGDACPGGGSGFVPWDVDTEPYGVDNMVDERGNNDGWACAKRIYVVIDEDGNPFQIYNFLDNKFQPQG